MRPQPRQGAAGTIGAALSGIYEDESGEESAYRGRVLLYAACEKPKPEEKLQVTRLPRSCLDAASKLPRRSSDLSTSLWTIHR